MFLVISLFPDWGMDANFINLSHLHIVELGKRAQHYNSNQLLIAQSHFAEGSSSTNTTSSPDKDPIVKPSIIFVHYQLIYKWLTFGKVESGSVTLKANSGERCMALFLTLN